MILPLVAEGCAVLAAALFLAIGRALLLAERDGNAPAGQRPPRSDQGAAARRAEAASVDRRTILAVPRRDPRPGQGGVMGEGEARSEPASRGAGRCEGGRRPAAGGA